MRCFSSVHLLQPCRTHAHTVANHRSTNPLVRVGEDGHAQPPRWSSAGTVLGTPKRKGRNRGKGGDGGRRSRRKGDPDDPIRRGRRRSRGRTQRIGKDIDAFRGLDRDGGSLEDDVVGRTCRDDSSRLQSKEAVHCSCTLDARGGRIAENVETRRVTGNQGTPRRPRAEASRQDVPSVWMDDMTLWNRKGVLPNPEERIPHIHGTHEKNPF